MQFNQNTVSNGLDKYQKIMSMVHSVDVSSNAQFQKLFNNFYKLRQKNASFYAAYFSFFEKHKNSEPSFKETIEYLYKETKEVHFSFSSKLIASINPMKPILDKYVMRWMGFELKDSSKMSPEDRIKYYCDVYDTIEREYRQHLHDKNVVEAIARFDHLFPQYSDITPVKKIDCFLYGSGDERTVSILDYNKLKEGHEE